MLKNVSKLECKIEDRLYQMLLDSDSPLPHVKEFCFQVIAYCAKVEEAVKEQLALQEQNKVEEKSEEVKDEGKEEAKEADPEAS